MNEDAQKELTRWLVEMRQAAGSARDFAVGQAPDVARELILRGRVESTLLVLACIAGLAVVAVGLRFCVRSLKKCGDYDEAVPFLVFGVVGQVFVGIIIAVFAVLVLHDFVSSWLTPRVYVLESLAALIGR